MRVEGGVAEDCKQILQVEREKTVTEFVDSNRWHPQAPSLYNSRPARTPQASRLITCMERSYTVDLSTSSQIRTLCVSLSSSDPTTNVSDATAIG